MNFSQANINLLQPSTLVLNVIIFNSALLRVVFVQC